VRIDRIMGVVLSILVVSFIALKYYSNEEEKTNPFELIGDNGYMSENVVSYQDKVFDSNKSNTEIIEFTNPYSYPVEINSSDIIITCTGSGETKESDEALARKNYHISAKFSEEKNGKLYNSLSVPKNNKIYIHIISEYSGDLPQNSVDCKYSLNIASS